MCGIFGVIANHNTLLSSADVEKLTRHLFKLSQTRGKDASGICVSNGKNLWVLKKNIAADQLIKSEDYKQLIRDTTREEQNKSSYFAAIGHSRMVTNGHQSKQENNQPVIKDDIVLIHNGIIVNAESLWQKNPDITREFDVDTEIIASLVRKYVKTGSSLCNAVVETYSQIEGAASIAFFAADHDNLYLASNNGSLYFFVDKQKNFMAFASEKYMLFSAIKNISSSLYDIFQVESGTGYSIDIPNLKLSFYRLNRTNDINDLKKDKVAIKDIGHSEKSFADNIINAPFINHSEESLLQYDSEAVSKLKRCTKCLLPESFPGISFDTDGVCSVCKTYQPVKYRGKENLEELLSGYRKSSGPDVILPLSGGRDSCYALHYLKKEMGMNPIAYTYDWGMVTDLARRNISRITSILGVEHILISADIRKKRENIQKNVHAWLKKPHLGAVPLFMAGDKQFFYYANQLRKQCDIPLTIFGMNPLERTDFKVAFTGISEKKKENRHFHLSNINKLKIAAFYAGEYLRNPAYINDSLFDTIGAFISYYFIKHDYQIFFEFIPWSESLVNDTIISKYDWEISEDTPTTWRIGDGTASFYNYIYFTIAGFTENDTFRSNQIRQGLITREKAIELVVEENRPRYQSIKWYCETIGLDFSDAIKRINNINKLYEKR
jgi:hypothetical protein